MGRFDALTELDEKKPSKKVKVLVDAASDTRKKPERPNELEDSPFFKRQTQQPAAKKPEIMKSGNHENVQLSEGPIEKPEKYSTLLHSSFIRKIKLYAAERDLKDYEVIELALTDLFEKHK